MESAHAVGVRLGDAADGQVHQGRGQREGRVLRSGFRPYAVGPEEVSAARTPRLGTNSNDVAALVFAVDDGSPHDQTAALSRAVRATGLGIGQLLEAARRPV